MLDSRRVLAPAPKVLGPKHISNSDVAPFLFYIMCVRLASLAESLENPIINEREMRTPVKPFNSGFGTWFPTACGAWGLGLSGNTSQIEIFWHDVKGSDVTGFVIHWPPLLLWRWLAWGEKKVGPHVVGGIAHVYARCLLGKNLNRGDLDGFMLP